MPYLVDLSHVNCLIFLIDINHTQIA